MQVPVSVLVSAASRARARTSAKIMVKSATFTLLPLLVVIGCGRHHGIPSPAEVIRSTVPQFTYKSEPAKEIPPWTFDTTPVPRKSHPTQCAVDEEAFKSRADLVDNDTMKVSLERAYQNVIRKDCEGRVISSQIETVQSPTTDVQFSPRTRPKKVGAVWLFNSTACDWTNASFRLDEGFIARWFGKKITRKFQGPTGNAKGDVQLTLDQGKGGATFHVSPGVNKVYYTYFDKCVPMDVQTRAGGFLVSDCQETHEVSSGSFLIDVDYREITLPGNLEVPAKDCEKH